MAEVRALKMGLSTQLTSGAKVFGVLSEDGACTCFDLTAPDGIVTRFALSDDALAAMVDIAVELRKRADGVSASAECPNVKGNPKDGYHCDECGSGPCTAGVPVDRHQPPTPTDADDGEPSHD